MSSTRRLKVLIFTNLFPTPGSRSFAIFNAQLVRKLQECCEIVVVCPLPWFPRWRVLRRFPHWFEFAEVPAEYHLDGVQVHVAKYPMIPKVSGSIQSLLVFVGSVLTVLRLHRKFEFDIMCSMWLYPDAVASNWIAALLKLPLVPVALGCDVNRMLFEPGKRRQILSMLRRAPEVITVSEELRRILLMEGIPAERVTTIPNGVDVELFSARPTGPARLQLALPLDKRLIVYVGRLSEEKNLLNLLEAIALLKEKRVDFVLQIVGGGEQHSILEARIRSLQIQDLVRLAGPQPHSNIPLWLSAADVFCLPSIREGCPNVVLEAIASGRPVVASNVGGIPSMVPNDCGLLIDPHNVMDLANALNVALSQNWDANQIASRVHKNSWASAAKRYVEIFERAI